jgi:ATP-dependent Zn protease
MSNSIPISQSSLSDVHIVLQDYSTSGIPSSTTNLECSIETSECDGQVRILAKDLRLFHNGSQCLQNIQINDTDDGVIQNFDCNHNTNFIQNTNFYTSQYNHIIISFANLYNQNGGFVWIQPIPSNFFFFSFFKSILVFFLIFFNSLFFMLICYHYICIEK